MSHVCAKMHVGFHAKYPLLLSSINWNWNVQNKFQQNSPIPNFMTTCSVILKLFNADEQANDTKRHISKILVANAPKYTNTVWLAT
jgi:hypothetical protein